MGLWDKIVVEPLISCACKSKPILKQREKVVPLADGRVLEIGCGAGTNFDYYDFSKVSHVHAIEPAGGMLKRARKKASAMGLTSDQVSFDEAGAEAMPIEDNSIDTAVITFVLCTIPDWEAALIETRRVLKPGGKIVFTEHGLAPDENVVKWQRRIEPVWKVIAGGCHVTRDVEKMFRDTGYALDHPQTMYVPGPKFAGFMTWGTARAA